MVRKTFPKPVETWACSVGDEAFGVVEAFHYCVLKDDAINEG